MDIKSYKIVLVDDDPVLLDLHSLYMEDGGYEFISACNGVDALSKIKANKDDIGVIISDVTMPEMDGYVLCEKIKNDSTISHIPVIFVSARSSLEEKLKGYAVGADDYIIKPVSEKELLEKSKLSIKRQIKITELEKSVTDSNTKALAAISYSSELVQVIGNNKKMLSSKSYEELAKHLFEITEHYELVSTLQIHTTDITLNFCDSGLVSPLEADVIEMARRKGKFFDFGAKTIINYEYFSILLKNMPVFDHDKYDRIKDIFEMICNGIETKIGHLINETHAEKEHKAIITIKNTLCDVEHLTEVVSK